MPEKCSSFLLRQLCRIPRFAGWMYHLRMSLPGWFLQALKAAKHFACILCQCIWFLPHTQCFQLRSWLPAIHSMNRRHNCRMPAICSRHYISFHLAGSHHCIPAGIHCPCNPIFLGNHLMLYKLACSIYGLHNGRNILSHRIS